MHYLFENVRISIEITHKFVPKGLINITLALFQAMAWRRPGHKFKAIVWTIDG